MSIDLTEREGRRLDVSSGGQDAALDVKPCGDCSLCCKVLRIAALDKAPGHWCPHFAKGAGCAIHSISPSECQRFQCLWSVSGGLGEEWRPDRAKFVLWSDNPARLIVDVDPALPGAWRLHPYYAQLKLWSDRSGPAAREVLVRVAGRLWVVFPEADIDLGPQRPDASIDSGYRIEDGRRIPYATYAEPLAVR